MSQALGAPPEPSGHTPGLTCSLLLSWEHRPPGPWWPPGPRPSERALWVRAVLWGPLQSRGSTAGPEGPRLAARSQGCHLRPSSVWGRAPHVCAGHPHRHMGWLPPASCGSQDRGEPACVCGRAPGPPGSGEHRWPRPVVACLRGLGRPPAEWPEVSASSSRVSTAPGACTGPPCAPHARGSTRCPFRCFPITGCHFCSGVRRLRLRM